MTTLRPPITCLDCREGIIAVPHGSTVQYHDALAGQVVSQSHKASTVSKNNDLKSVIVRLVAVGYAPATGSEEREPIVASISEDKKLRLVRAKTGELLYERTLIKKASTISIEEDGTVIVADKVGDVFAYPFTDDSKGDPSTSSTPRPEATIFAVDPSLNPDADLLVGHVSAVGAHIMTPDRKSIITADRDEHIRISRYPQSYVIERYLFGHTSFVSALCIPPSQPDILYSAGGDPSILIHRISTGELINQIPLEASIKPYRTVRALMRRTRKRPGDNGRMGGVVQGGEERQMLIPGKLPYTDEEYASAPDGFGLPSGEGICVTKMETVGRDVVFFSEGCSAIQSFRLQEDPSTAPQISTLPLPSPVLSFCALSSSSSSSCLLVSLDSAWKHRVDGGKAFEQPPDSAAFIKKGKGRQPEVKPSVVGPVDIDADRQVDLVVVEIGEVGQLKDVSADYKVMLSAIQDTRHPIPIETALSISSYSNLTVLPKWTGQEDDDVEEEQVGETGSPAPAQLSNLGKRALGQLKAKGVDVDAKLLDLKKERKKEARKEAKEKKRKLNEDAKAEGSGEVDVVIDAQEEEMNA